MTSKNLRSFSAGIIVSTGILAGVYYASDSTETALNKESVEQFLSEKGEIAISKEEYTTLKDVKKAAPVPEKPPEKKEQAKPEEPKVVSMTLTITQGMSTGEVCDLLEKGKIIKNGDDFLKYLRAHNLEGAVRAESHQVNSGMSFDEIAKEITTS